MRPTSAYLPLGYMLVTSLLSFGTAQAFHEDITCERTIFSTQGFVHKSHAESWFPEQLKFSSGNFQHVSDDLKLLRYVRAVTTTGGQNYSAFYYLFPDGRLSVSISDRSGYKSTGASYYKCDKTALQVRREKLNLPN